MVADCVAAAITRNRLSTATRAELENRLPTATFRRHVTTSRCRGSRSCNQNASGAKRRRPRSEEDDGDLKPPALANRKHGPAKASRHLRRTHADAHHRKSTTKATTRTCIRADRHQRTTDALTTPRIHIRLM